jgi:uncharacterized membrane protein
MILLGACHASLQRDREVSEQQGNQVAPFSENSSHNHELFPSSSLNQTGHTEIEPEVAWGTIFGIVVFLIAIVAPVVECLYHMKQQYDQMQSFKSLPTNQKLKIVGCILFVLLYIYCQVLAVYAFDRNEESNWYIRKAHCSNGFECLQYYVGVFWLCLDYVVLVVCIIAVIILLTCGELLNDSNVVFD